MSETPKETDAGDVAPAAPKSKTGLIVVFLILNSALLAGVLAVVLLKSSHAPAPAAHAEAEKSEGGGEHGGGEGKEGEHKPAVGPTVHLADFIIHLRNPEADRYARLSFDIEVSTEKEKEAVTPHLPKIRDAFITHLSDQTAEDLRGSEGIEKTKQALLARLSAMVPGAHARAIYITDFVIQ